MRTAAAVTQAVKKELRLAELPAYQVTTRWTRLSDAGPEHGWQSIVHGVDAGDLDTVELVMGNLPNLIDTTRREGFLSVITGG